MYGRYRIAIRQNGNVADGKVPVILPVCTYVYFDGVIVKIEKVYEKIFYINMATSDHRISEKRRWKIFAKVA